MRTTASTRFSHWTVSVQTGIILAGKRQCHRLYFSTKLCKNVVVTKQVKNTIAVLAIFSIRRMEAQLAAIRMTEQPISKRRVILGIWSISCLSIFSRNGQSNLLLVLALALESKGAYYWTIQTSVSKLEIKISDDKWS